jgi:predicted phosphodiesterase
MILAISDLHLGAKASNSRGIYHFIDGYVEPHRSDIDHLFLLGDVFDLWRGPNAEVIVENQKLLDRLSSLDIKVHYLFGNHDFVTRDIGEWLSSTDGLYGVSSWDLLQRSVGKVKEVEVLEYDGLNLRFCHGHQIDYWMALDFYEIFCEAMCKTTGKESASEEWDGILELSRGLSSEHQSWARQASNEMWSRTLRALAGPVTEPQEDTVISGMDEWNVLTHFLSTDRFRGRSDGVVSPGFGTEVDRIADQLVSHSSVFRDARSHKMSHAIDRLARLWTNLWSVLERYETENEVPRTVLRAVSRAKRLMGGLTIGLSEYEFLIRGHGHRPYVDASVMTADPGCWLGSRGSFLEIADGEVRACQWE